MTEQNLVFSVGEITHTLHYAGRAIPLTTDGAVDMNKLMHEVSDGRLRVANLDIMRKDVSVHVIPQV